MRAAAARAAFLLVSLAGSASAGIIAGRDCAGQDLVCDGSPVCGSGPACSDGDQLEGTFTRVRLFSVGAGTTVFISQGTPLVVYASTIALSGTISGIGRGFAGGAGGLPGSAGFGGTGGGVSFAGGGAGGAAAKGGAGGGHGGAGGDGTSSSARAAGGAIYGSTGAVTSPLSADDVSMGGGGGGGGGGQSAASPGGAPGGGAIYLEASSITVSGAGSIIVNGAEAAAFTETGVGIHPGGGGGGAGGGILLRALQALSVTGTGSLSAKGGDGADTASLSGGTWNPGGGGGGGRIKLFARSLSAFSISVSTAFGAVGGKLSGTFDSTGTFNNGSSGTVSFGILPSSPAAASVAAVFLTSATWGWSGATVDWGDAPPSSRRFRVHAATASAPLDWAEVTASSGASTGTETDLLPNTTYSRVITAFTEWGDSIASAEVATCTLASVPGPPAGVSTFTNVQERQLTFNWGAGSPANPSVTTYEVWRSTVSDFGSAVHSSLEAQVSTTPVNLAPETVYYFRVRAQSLYGALTDFTTTFAIATSTTVPQAPGSPRPDSPFSYDGTATFRWAAAFSPSGIREYFLEIGSFPGGADFLSRSVGNVTTYQASGLSSKKTYYGRVRAVSNAEVTSSFSDAGPPVSVFLSAQEPAVAKPRGYPNPFDPTEGPAQVAFSLAEPAAVTLKLYTLQGLLVYQETRAFGAGNQVFPWNGASGSGVRVAAGGYIGVIEKGYAAGKETQRFKLAVVH